MVASGVMTLAADVLKEAGADVSSSATVEAFTNYYILRAEAHINVLTRWNWVTNWTDYNDELKLSLGKAVACLAAQDVIKYDMSVIGNQEAQNRILVLKDIVAKIVESIKDRKPTDFIRKG